MTLYSGFFFWSLNHPRVLCWDSMPFCEKWIYYILQELHWWSLVVWTTAVINGNMNFADTLYWLQIVTTTASNHSHHSHNSLIPPPKLCLSLPPPSHFFDPTDHPNLKLSHVSLVIPTLKKIILQPTELGQLHQHITSWRSLSAVEITPLLWWLRWFVHSDQLYHF